MKNKDYLRSQGFTFIEILVVVTIIAVLTMIGVTNFGVANKKARDGKRKGDLEQIRASLELYYTDESSYPADLSTLEDDYINEVPSDPLSTQDYYYNYDAVNKTYVLCAALELDTTAVGGCGSCGSGTCSYSVSNPL